MKYQLGVFPVHGFRDEIQCGSLLGVEGKLVVEYKLLCLLKLLCHV